jgi:hypothetical protein
MSSPPRKTPLFAHNFSIRILFAYRKQCFVDKHQQSCAGDDKKQQFQSFPAQGDFQSLPRLSHLSLSLARSIGRFSTFHFAFKDWSQRLLPVGKCSSLKVVASNCYGCESESVQKKREKISKRDCEIPFFQLNFESTIIFIALKNREKKSHPGAI